MLCISITFMYIDCYCVGKFRWTIGAHYDENNFLSVEVKMDNPCISPPFPSLTMASKQGRLERTLNYEHHFSPIPHTQLEWVEGSHMHILTVSKSRPVTLLPDTKW